MRRRISKTTKCKSISINVEISHSDIKIEDFVEGQDFVYKQIFVKVEDDTGRVEENSVMVPPSVTQDRHFENAKRLAIIDALYGLC